MVFEDLGTVESPDFLNMKVLRYLVSGDGSNLEKIGGPYGHAAVTAG